MTVFWSDPTKISLAMPSGDELENENYFNPPNTITSRFKDLGIVGPGVAEIKAHNWNGIFKAIDQLSKFSDDPALAGPSGTQPTNWRFAQKFAEKSKLPNPPNSKKKRPDLAKVIVTYRPTGWSRANPGATPSPLTLDVYAVKFEPTRKEVTYYHTDQRGRTASAPWVLVKEAVRIPPRIAVNLDNGSVLGAAAEGPVRAAFADALRGIGRQPYNLDKGASAHGLDVVWTEIAEMYAELARTTNDEFLGELASELAAPR